MLLEITKYFGKPILEVKKITIIFMSEIKYEFINDDILFSFSLS